MMLYDLDDCCIKTLSSYIYDDEFKQVERFVVFVLIQNHMGLGNNDGKHL